MFHIFNRIGLFEKVLGVVGGDDEVLRFADEIRVASAKERTDDATVEEVFFWVGEDGSVRNKQRMGNTCGRGKLDSNILGGLGGVCADGLLDEKLNIGGEVLVADEKFGENIAVITATRGVAFDTRIEAEDTGVAGVMSDTLEKGFVRTIHSKKGGGGGDKIGEHRNRNR